MAVTHAIDALVREHPGISQEELRLTFGRKLRSALKRLELVGYIERVQSDGKVLFYPVEQPTDMTVLLG